MNKFSLVFIGGGSAILALSLVMGWLGAPQMMKSQIKKGSRLLKGSRGYNMWKGPSPVPSLLKFYFFNVTNPKEVQEGEKPLVEELGPYTYKQIKEKIDIKPGEIKNDTVQYREVVWLYPSYEFSNGSLDDMITFINVPFISVVKLVANSSTKGQSLKDIDVKLTENGESLFKTVRVQDLLFDGFSVEPFVTILNGPSPSDTIENENIPNLFRSGKFAFYNGKNGSDDGSYEIDVGLHNYKEVGQIQAWNNYTSLPWWKGESCNNISNSTDGSIFAPFIDRQSILKTFTPEMCRRLEMIYESDISFKGVPGFKFVWDKRTFLGPQENQDNWCYCVDSDLKLCEKKGIISLSSCTGGMPLWMSLPHFLGAETSILEEINGLNPDDKKHGTFINIEPDTAIIFQAAKRFQMNIQLEQIQEMPTFSKVRNMMFPIMWVEESFELTDNFMQIFAQMQMILDIVDQGRWILIASSCGAVGIGIIVGMLKREKIK